MKDDVMWFAEIEYGNGKIFNTDLYSSQAEAMLMGCHVAMHIINKSGYVVKHIRLGTNWWRNQ